MNLNKTHYSRRSIVERRAKGFVCNTLKQMRYFLVAISIAAMATSPSNANALTEEEKVSVLMVITKSYLKKRTIPDGVCVFSKTRFRGHRQCFTESNPKLNDKLNNNVSSITVSPDYQATIYQDEYYAGGFDNFSTNAETIDTNLVGTITSVAVAAANAQTSPNGQVNPNDMDLDGVNNADDFCADTTPQATVNEYGCSAIQILNGGGGGNGNSGPDFQCIDPVTGAASNDPNCPDAQRDSDFDGVIDSVDPYPLQAGTQCPLQ